MRGHWSIGLVANVEGFGRIVAASFPMRLTQSYASVIVENFNRRGPNHAERFAEIAWADCLVMVEGMVR